MNKMIKKVLAGFMAAAIALTAVPATSFAATSPATSVEPVKQTSVVAEKTSSGITPTVSTKADGTAKLTEIAATKKTKVTVPSTVTVDGVEYKVTTLAANALSNAKKATQVTVPKSITTINKSAFSGLTKVKTIKLNTTKSITVKKGAFKGLSTKKITITVNKKISAKQYKQLKAELKAAGFKGTIKKA